MREYRMTQVRLYGVVALALAAFVMWAAVPAAAQAVDDVFGVSDDLFLLDENDLFSLDEDDLFSFDEDSLFGGGGLLTVEEPDDQALEEVFLVQERIDIGGSYRAALEGVRAWGSDGAALGSDVLLTAGGTLFVDARPSRDFRAFAKVKGDGVWTDDKSDAAVRLHELFADFVVGERAFFRVGKQTVTWGVGYFFSPGDVINIGQIDPENPDAEREGPVAIRLNVPAGRNNWYGYAIVSGNADDGYRVALAPKAEFVMGRSELGLGLYYRADRAPRAMATLSTSVGPLAVFSELVVGKGSDKRFVRETTPSPGNPLGLETYTDDETLFVHATAGARYTYSDPDGRFTLTAAGQYYVNGEGYEPAFLEEHGLKLPVLLLGGELRATDVQWPGRHYGALLVGGSHQHLRDLSANALWLGSLSDGSGMVNVSLAYGGWKYVRPSLTISRTYGDIGSQFGMTGPVTSVTLGVSVSGSF